MPTRTMASSTSASTRRTSRRTSPDSKVSAQSYSRGPRRSRTARASHSCAAPTTRGWSWWSRERSPAAPTETVAPRDRDGCSRRKGQPGSRPPSLREELVGPLDQLHQDRGISEGRVLSLQVRREDPPGPRTRASNVYGNAQRHRRLQRLGQGRPADGNDRVCDRTPHQRDGFAEQENLHFVTAFRQRVTVQKGKRGLGGIIGSPCALDEDLAHEPRA